MNIDIIKIENGWAVKFPFRLKDDFKRAFPSAKWNPTAKQWEVGRNSKTRLEMWTDEVKGSGVIEAIAELNEQELTQKERDELQRNLRELKETIRRVLENREQLEDMKAQLIKVRRLLDEEESELDRAKAQLAKAKEAAIAEKTAIKELLSGIIDLDEIMWAKEKMEQWHKGVGSTAKEQFYKAQAVIDEAKGRLLEAGLVSRGLDKLSKANFNRPDRDNASFVSYDDILLINKS